MATIIDFVPLEHLCIQMNSEFIHIKKYLWIEILNRFDTLY